MRWKAGVCEDIQVFKVPLRRSRECHEGRKEGRKEGSKEGRKEGSKEGRKERRKEGMWS